MANQSAQKILITGATGFIGGHLLPTLGQANYSITIALRDSHCSLPHPHITPISVGSIDGTTNWQPSLNSIHTVIHLAARAHQLQDTAPDLEEAFWQVNVAGTANLVKQSIAAGVQHFVFISSIGAMATLSPECLTEETPCWPDTPYGRSKLAAEQALIELAKGSSMTWTILRPTLVYGPNNPGNMERLLKLVYRGLPLPLGVVNNQRSFLFVGNLVDAITQCINNPKAFNQTFLVSDGHNISTPELIKQIAFSLHKRPNLLPIPPTLLKLVGQLTGKSDTVDRLTGSLMVDSSKIRQTLNWTPPYTFQEGIQKTCDWYLQSRQNDH